MTDGWIDEAYGPSATGGSEWVDEAIGPASQGQPLSFGEGIAGGFGKVLNALTFNLGDEITAGGSAAIDALAGNGSLSDAYDQRLNQVRDIQNRYGNWLSEKSPVSSAFLDYGPALFLPWGGKTIEEAKGFVPTAKALAKVGGSYGAAYGFGGGEGGLENRLTGAAQGGLAGAIATPLIGGGLIGGGKTLSGLASLIGNFRGTGAEELAASKLLEAGGSDISNLPPPEGPGGGGGTPYYQYQTLGEATQNPMVAQLEQSTLKESKLGNMLLNENRDARQGAYSKAMEGLSTLSERTPEQAGADIRGDILAPRAQDAYGAAETAYQNINQEAQAPVMALRKQVTELVRSEYQAGGAPSQLNGLVDEINRIQTFGDVRGKPKVQAYSYLQDLRERAQEAYQELRYDGSKKGARVANSIVRTIDGTIEAGARNGTFTPQDVAEFQKGKALFSQAKDTYDSGKVGAVLGEYKKGKYFVEDAQVVDKLWTGTPKGTQDVLGAVGNDAARIDNVRGAIRDKILNEVTDNNDQISWPKLSKWLRQNRGGLSAGVKNTDGTTSKLFEPDHLNSIQQIADDLELTAPSSSKSTGKLAYKGSEGQPTTAQALMMAQGSAWKRALPVWMQAAVDLAINGREIKANDILAKAFFDKEFAKTLIAKASEKNIQKSGSLFTKLTQGRKNGGGLSAALIGRISGGDNQNKGSLSSALSQDQNMDSPKIQSATRSPEVEKLAKAVASAESGGLKNRDVALSSAGAQGYMQIMPATAKESLKEMGEDPSSWDPTDRKMNIRVGTHYLEKMMKQFGDVKLALAAYNMGPDALQRAIDKFGTTDWEVLSKRLKDKGAYLETVAYVPKVLKRLDITEV